MNRTIIVAIAFLASFRFAGGQVTTEQLNAYLWEYPLQQGLVINPQLMQEVVVEMQRIIDSGDLFFRPLPNDFSDQAYDHYFLYMEPGRILQTIAMAYPYLDASMQASFRSMVADLLANATHCPWASNPLPLDAGKQRKPFAPATLWGQGSSFGLYRPTIQNVYGIWLYAYRTGDLETIGPYYNNIRSFYVNKVGGNHDQGRLYSTMNAHIGMARLAHLFGEEAHVNQARTNLQNAMIFGLHIDQVDTLARRGTQGWNGAYAFAYEDRAINWINRNYIFHNLSPEIGRYLQDYLPAQTEVRHNYMMNRFPMWWLREAPYFNRWSGDEGIGIPGNSFGTNVPLERWFRNVDAETLASYMVSAPAGIADSYWIEALIMAIEADATDVFVDVRDTSFSLDVTTEDEVVTLPELILEAGSNECFSSSHTLIVGGNGNSFRVEPDATVRLEAGHTIRMLEGTTIQGSLLARIVVDDLFCVQQPAMLAVAPADEGTLSAPGQEAAIQPPSHHSFRILVYPNPTDGIFTLELPDLAGSENVFVQVVNLTGYTLSSHELPAHRLHQLTVPEGTPGIYFIRVLQGSNIATARIILY